MSNACGNGNALRDSHVLLRLPGYRLRFDQTKDNNNNRRIVWAAAAMSIVAL